MVSTAAGVGDPTDRDVGLAIATNDDTNIPPGVLTGPNGFPSNNASFLAYCESALRSMSVCTCPAHACSLSEQAGIPAAWAARRL